MSCISIMTMDACAILNSIQPLTNTVFKFRKMYYTIHFACCTSRAKANKHDYRGSSGSGQMWTSMWNKTFLQNSKFCGKESNCHNITIYIVALGCIMVSLNMDWIYLLVSCNNGSRAVNNLPVFSLIVLSIKCQIKVKMAVIDSSSPIPQA